MVHGPRRSAVAPLIAGVVMMLLLGGRIDAQERRALEPLAIPDGAPIRCRVYTDIPKDPSGSAGRGFEFAIGRPLEDERVIVAAFDSVGRPRFLTEMVTHWSESGELAIHSVAARFADDSVVAGFHQRSRRDGRTAPQPPHDAAAVAGAPMPALSADERRQAVTLAAWLWARRCGRGSASAR